MADLLHNDTNRSTKYLWDREVIPTKRPLLAAVLVGAVSVVLPAAYAYLGISGFTVITPGRYFLAVFVLFLGVLIIASLFWRYRRQIPLLIGAYTLSYVLAVGWYSLPQPLFTLLVTHFNEHQMQWFAFTWLWLLPIHGLVVLGAFTVFAHRPLVKWQDPRRVYRYTLRLPTIMAWGVVAVATIGYVLGATQLRFLASTPWIEVWKLYVLGFISSIFLGICFYFAFEAAMRPIRIGLEKKGHVRPATRSVYARRIFLTTSTISLGVLLFMGMVVLRAYQDIVAENVQNITRTRIEEYVSRRQESVPEVSTDFLKISANTRITVIAADQEFSSLSISTETQAMLSGTETGSIIDRQLKEVAIHFFSDPLTQQKIIVQTPLSDFYQPIINGMRLYAMAAGVVFLLAVVVTWYFSATLARTLRSLSTAVRTARDSLQSFTFNTYTADELEELSRAFRYYINQSNELRAHLEDKVKQRTDELLQVEEEKRALEVAAAQQQTKLEHKQRELAEETAEKLEEKVRERTAALRDAVRHLQEMDRVKSEFISLASHQLRTPLTSLRWAQHALLEGSAGDLNGDQKQIVSTTLDRTLYMMNLVNELLDVTRIEEARYDLKPAPLNPNTLLEGIIQELQAAAEHKGVVLALKIDGTLPQMVADADKVKMAISNIADNGIKYTNKGGSVTIAAKQVKDAVIVTIQDTGVGIPEQDVYRTFSKFFRASNAVSMHTSGSGLGLYIAKTIVEKHGGTIALESKVGKGTTVTLTIPIQQPLSEVAAAIPEQPNELGALKSLVDKEGEGEQE